jgi:hypothetical protein
VTPREPRDLRAYLEPPLSDQDVERHLEGGRRRLARHRRRRLALGLATLAVTGTAAAALLPRLHSRSEGLSRPRTQAGERRAVAARRALPPALSPSAEAPVPLPARAADAFADSVGLHVRMWYQAYDGRHHALTRERLVDVGVRHVFDVSRTRLDRLRGLGALGIRVHVLLRADGDAEVVARGLGASLGSLHTDWRFGEQWREGLLDEAWAKEARAFAESTHRKVRQSPLLAGVPLVGPSVRAPYETALVGDLAAFADLGALNYWPAPGPPDTGRLAVEMAAQRQVFPGKDLIVTQSGYTTAPLALAHVSEPVQARYLLRLHLEAFGAGVVRTFANQLIDFSRDPASPDGGIGLLRWDGSPKPAFAALKALLAALSDRGPAFAPGSLAFSVDSAEGDLRQVLLQKRNGTFVIALWLARPSDEQPVRRAATLRLPAPARRLRTLDPHGIRTPVEVFGTSALAIEVSDAVLLVEVEP